MRFERRPRPSRRDIITRVTATALLAWILYAFPGSFEFSYGEARASFSSLFHPDAAVWVLKEYGIVVLMAAIGAHLEESRGRRQADLAMAILAYVAARALTGGLTYPGSLNSWSPYPVSHWFQEANFLLPGVFLQALILRPVWPVLVRDVGKIRGWAAVILCVLPFLLWDWLSGSVGSASAALICALTLVLVMMLAGRRRLALFALVSSAGFLAVSALAQHGPPPAAPGIGPDVDLHIALSAADASGMSMTVNVFPGAPTLFGCPAQTRVSIDLYLTQPTNPKDMPHYNKLLADLARSPYTLDVSGTTRITDDAKVTGDGTSRVIYEDGTHTEWRAAGFNINRGNSAPQQVSDIFRFSLPLQSWRSMGTCYVTTPQLNQAFFLAATSYLAQPASGAVSVYAEPGTSVDLTNSLPRQTDKSPSNSTDEWDLECFDYSHHGSAGSSGQCPAIAVMAAGWSVSYPQVALLVAGALIAIAAERWFRVIHPEELGEEKKAAGRG